MQRFVMFAMPRTGSSWLQAALDSHPDITCYTALFRRHRLETKEFVCLQQEPDPRFYETEYRIANFEKLLEVIFEQSIPTRHVGLKHMAGGQPKIRDYLARDPQCRKVILRRENLLAVYSSNALVAVTGQGTVLPDEEIKRARAVFDRQEFEKLSLFHERKYLALREMCAGDVIEVEYNALRRGDDMNRLGAFFDVDPTQMKFDQHQKRNSDSIIDRFENRDEVLAYLKERDCEGWAEER